MTTWDELEADLGARLADLAVGAYVVLRAGGAAERTVVRRRRRLGGLVPEARAAQRPYVQLRRLEDDLWAECVGGPQVGGDFPWTDAEAHRIADLGWAAPDPVRVPVRNVWREWLGVFGPAREDLPDAARAAAALVTATLRVTGCTADDVVLEAGT